MTNPTIASLLDRIGEYRRKYYQNQLIKGVIFALGLVFTAYLFINTVEYFGRFSTSIRSLLFFGFVAILGYALVRWVAVPLVHLYGLSKPISDETAAVQIGNFFPEIGDKLLNTLQLRGLSGTQTDLIEASIKQKSKQLLVVRFADAIKINENRKYAKYAIYPLLAIVGILLFNPRFFSGSSDRLIHFQKNYSYAPFAFKLENKDLKAFKNEDFTLRVTLTGESLPQAVYLTQNKAKFKLDLENGNTYSYTFKNVQRPIDFQFDAAGYQSDSYEIKVSERPNLLSFDVKLNYPAYLGKPAESLSNVGNLTVPEGTTVTWDFNASSTDSMSLSFDGDKNQYPATEKILGGFEFKKYVRKSSSYQVNLKNEEAANREKISYYLNVIADKYPTLNLENYQDTTLYNYFVVGGTIADDYGFSNLKLFYNIQRKGQKDNNKQDFKGFQIPFNKSAINQTFYYQWYVDSLRLAPGDRIEYFVQAWDNDGVNGAKSAKSRVVNFAVPSKDAVRAEIEKSSEKTEAQLEKTLDKAKSLQKELDKLDQRLKSEKELDFQEKKQVEELLKKRDELANEMKDLQEQNQKSQQKQERFAQENPELKQKLEQLQKLMNELLDPETKKLYEQLEKMLEKSQQDDKMQELMNKLKNKEFNTQKEIEKALEMFKRMQVEQKAEQIKKDLEEQAEKQEKLAEKTEKDDKDGKDKDKEADDKKKDDELKKEQDELNKEFEKTKEDLEDLEKKNEELDKPEDMDTDKDTQEEIEKDQKQSSEDIAKKQKKEASKKQKKAAKSMKKMAKAMGEMMEDMEAKEDMENIDDLRKILENLIQLSFDQERLMKDFRGVNLQDPRFVKLGQEQLKLKDDSKVVEDSLYALAKRVMQIQTFVTRELSDMKYQMGEATRFIKERRLNQATSRQQFAMTAMNNLALMLSQTLSQMQAQAMAMPGPGGSGKGKKGKKPSPSLGDMQKQLNERIKAMQQGKGQMGGRAMSEELAKMAAEQGRIRQMLQQLADGQKGTEAGKKMGDAVKELSKDMDETETDLVNKRVNQELQKRQQDIVTRLLESEKALRQQEEDNQRKSETGKQIQRTPPPAFEQYVKDKQKQTELLRSVPPSFSPFYKREVNNYFKKYGNVNP